MPMIRLNRNKDWGICTTCRHFVKMGDWSECRRSGDPLSEETTCELYQPRGNCDTCARKVAEYRARGARVVECMDCGSTSFVRFKEDCSGYRERVE